MDKQIVSEVMASIARKGHRKNPRPKDFYRRMQKKSVLTRKKNQQKKLSPVEVDVSLQ